MKLNTIGANQTEITVGDAVILFSYKTPVAYRGPEGCFRTDCRWSNTTSKHITLWGAKNYETKPQKWFDDLAGRV